MYDWPIRNLPAGGRMEQGRGTGTGLFVGPTDRDQAAAHLAGVGGCLCLPTPRGPFRSTVRTTVLIYTYGTTGNRPVS